MCLSSWRGFEGKIHICERDERQRCHKICKGGGKQISQRKQTEQTTVEKQNEEQEEM